MKHPKSKSAFIAFVCVMVFMLGCTEEENPVTPPQHGLPGTWALQKITIISQDESVVMEQEQLAELGIMWSLKFKIDKSFKYVSNLTGTTTVEQGFWSTKADTLELVFYNGSQQKLHYAQQQNDLILKWRGFDDGVQEDFTAELYRPVAD